MLARSAPRRSRLESRHASPAPAVPSPRHRPCARRLAPLRRRARVDALLAAQADHPGQRRLAGGRLDLRHRRRVQGLRDAVPARRGARCPLRELAEAARVRARRRHRRAQVELRPVRGPEDLAGYAHPRAHVLGARRGAPHLLRRASVAVRARRPHGQADRELRRQGPDRHAPRLRGPRPGRGQHPRQHARRLLRRPADPGLGRPGGAALGARRHSRLRHPQRPPEVGLPHDPPPRRARLRHLAKGRLEAQRRRERLVGALARPRARARLRRDRLRVLRLLRRRPRRRQPVREHDPVPEGGDRRARLALPGGQARRVGPRLPGRARAHHDHEGRQASRHRRADRQERPDVRARP